jgi:glyoxylase-like metal-dependent hydrolase (beta-lactamase superfamily II)
MPGFLCATCGVQYPDGEAPPARCFICEDERQFVPKSGQRWLTPEELAASHSNMFRALRPELIGVSTVPAFGIGQRALLLRTPSGNVLWDCISLLDAATIDIVKGLGGLKAVAISHPHYYSVMASWGRAFDCPVLVHAADRNWVARPDPHLEFWEGESREILPGVVLHRHGGHFPGASVLHWAERRLLLSGDTALVMPDRKHVSFMWSYPNQVPLPAAEVKRISARFAALDFDAIYAGFWDREIETDAKAAVARSAARYIQAVTGPGPLR